MKRTAIMAFALIFAGCLTCGAQDNKTSEDNAAYGRILEQIRDGKKVDADFEIDGRTIDRIMYISPDEDKLVQDVTSTAIKALADHSEAPAEKSDKKAKRHIIYIPQSDMPEGEIKVMGTVKIVSRQTDLLSQN